MKSVSQPATKGKQLSNVKTKLTDSEQAKLDRMMRDALKILRENEANKSSNGGAK